MSRLLTLCCALCPTLALASEPAAIRAHQVPVGTAVISAQNLTSERCSAVLDAKGFTNATVYIDYTHGSGNVTDVQLEAYAGPTATTLGQLRHIHWSAGTGESKVAVFKEAVSGSLVIRWMLGPLNDAKLKVCVSGLGTPDATDLVTTYIRWGVIR